MEQILTRYIRLNALVTLRLVCMYLIWKIVGISIIEPSFMKKYSREKLVLTHALIALRRQNDSVLLSVFLHSQRQSPIDAIKIKTILSSMQYCEPMTFLHSIR